MISGIGRYGHTVSLQWLSGRGVRLLGHVTGAANGRLTLNDDLGANIAWGDRTSGEFSALMDRAIGVQGDEPLHLKSTRPTRRIPILRTCTR